MGQGDSPCPQAYPTVERRQRHSNQEQPQFTRQLGRTATAVELQTDRNDQVDQESAEPSG